MEGLEISEKNNIELSLSNQLFYLKISHKVKTRIINLNGKVLQNSF
ncbi:hypothetical protein AVDCRST_MAG92-5064 [uncultured Coleofasciculus sp.]|uniref:Uncharacterized protein n=1 Tax=uncultured Coleofasciculus sp. TaxID=1267456 RepID=A0A6J4KCT0_9CYAN|nr:hypothetical protein AVDCRST_MAG92-5064 [uncultured Coleofasciculus sp.]